MSDDAFVSSLAPMAAKPVVVDSPMKRIARAFFEDKLAVFGLVLFLVIVLLAIFAPLLAPQTPYDL
ncbi:peptide ABC transporter permease, partial [Rhodopseudomonas palustris]